MKEIQTEDGEEEWVFDDEKFASKQDLDNAIYYDKIECWNCRGIFHISNWSCVQCCEWIRGQPSDESRRDAQEEYERIYGQGDPFASLPLS